MTVREQHGDQALLLCRTRCFLPSSGYDHHQYSWKGGQAELAQVDG